ncbi:TrkA family potassium uptake protein [Thalassococcus sp. S3]|uniref:potassium channel family protein n=1 Tax=Thalassococcus sp. S3 TaxID=2017482 RepID=UPI001023F8D6|nr:NAD-binding protein [Thalassococcus sp. S3]QBF33380.1 potassium transporter [Thalassococcus sp. S3]
MRVTILGASRFGAAIAERLIEDDHEVVLIDKERARLDKLSERLDCGMIEGDGTMPSVLRDAHRSDEDVFIAVTNASDDNILASLVARSVGFARVIPQITAAELLDVCHELELDDVINPHATVAESICAGLEDDTALDQDAMLHNQLAMQRLHVPDRYVGKAIGELDLPKHARVVAVVRGEDEEFAENDTVLSADDCLIVAIKRIEAEALAKRFAD